MRSTPKKLAASLAILAGVGAFVSYGVFSSWSSTATNSSSLTTGTLSLANNPALGTLNLTGLIPGDLLTRCFVVENDGDLPADVTVTASTTGSNASLLGALDVSIEHGTGASGTAGSCTGFTFGGFLLGTADLSGTPIQGNELVAPLTPQFDDWAAGATKSFRVKVTLPTSIVDATLQGKTANLDLTWTAAQNAGNPNRTS